MRDDQTAGNTDWWMNFAVAVFLIAGPVLAFEGPTKGLSQGTPTLKGTTTEQASTLVSPSTESALKSQPELATLNVPFSTSWDVHLKSGKQWYNIRVFGAVGDGATDDGTAIQNAVEEACSNGGGFIYWPAGAYLSHHTIFGNGYKEPCSNIVHIAEKRAVLDFEPMCPCTTRNLNDRALIFDWLETTVPRLRPIAGSLAIGATSFIARNGRADTGDLVPGTYIQIVETDYFQSGEDAMAFDWGIVESVHGDTVNLVQGLRTAFPNSHKPETLNFYKFTGNEHGVLAHNVGVVGLTVRSNQSGTSTPGIDMHHVWGGIVQNTVVRMSSGQPYYSYRSVGVRWSNIASRNMNGNLSNSEWAESADFEISNYTGTVIGPPAPNVNACLEVDFGSTRFMLSNIRCGSQRCGQLTFIHGPHDGTVFGFSGGYMVNPPPNSSCVLLDGAQNISVIAPHCAGGSGGARSFGVQSVHDDYGQRVIPNTGNVVVNPKIAHYPTRFRILPEDTLIQ